jgi:rhodanese-related sulfurtransferase
MYEDITPREFLALESNDAAWRLLDVREPWEIEIASVPGTVNIPMAEIPDRIGELDSTAPIAVLCHSGIRSARVAAFLTGRGFVRVANIAGGIDAWSADLDNRIPRY